MDRPLLMILLVLALVTLGQARSARSPRSVKGGGVKQVQPGVYWDFKLEDSPDVEDTDRVVDPSYYPEEYPDDYRYTDESYLHSKNYISSYEDDDDDDDESYEESEEYDDSDDDWYGHEGSNHPIIVTLDGGESKGYDTHRYDVEDEYDDKVKDPDFVPDYSIDYEDDDETYDPTNPDHVVSDSDDEVVDHSDDYDYGAYLDELWSSDDDPDYIPEDGSVDVADGHDDGTTTLDAILRQIAILKAVDKCQSDFGVNYVGAFYQALTEYSITIDQAKLLLGLQQNSYDLGLAGGVQDPVIGVPQPEIEVSSSVKGKRQIKSGQIQQQSGQIQQQSGQIQQESGQIQQQSGQIQQTGEVDQIDQLSHDQREPVISTLDQSDVSVGVEPLYPDGGREVGVGVEPVDSGSDSDSDFGDWLRRTWGHAGDAAESVGNYFEDTFDGIGDRVSGAVDTIHGVASNAVDRVQDAAESAGETIVSTYHSLKDRLPELREKIRHLFSKFGTMVQRGADYCAQHIVHAANQVREAEILDKLQQKLSEGNTQVTEFFNSLGQKVTSWAQDHGQEDIDGGLIIVGDINPQEGVSGHHTVGGDQQDREELFPNFFQDQDMVDQLNQLVSSGIITQDEVDLLSQQQQGQQNIQVLRPRKRSVRSRVRIPGHH